MLMFGILVFFSFHFAAIIAFLWPHGVLFKEKAQ